MSDSAREHRFTPTTLFVTGSLLIWLLTFALVYVFAALACARGFAGMRLGGMPLVPAVTTVCVLLAAIGTLWLVRRGLRYGRTQEAEEHSRFVGFVASASGVLALLALVWVGLPPLLIGGCRP
ncbi:MAG TPA: hypothetical protein VIL28_01770 [Steroidobacteraceae bacterium]